MNKSHRGPGDGQRNRSNGSRLVARAARTAWPVGAVAALVAACSSSGIPASPSAAASDDPAIQLAGAKGTSARLDPTRIDESARLTLIGNTHPSATAANSVGPLRGDQLIEHMQLVLKRSPDQETALEATIDALHDQTSPIYQQWLGVHEFAEQYGVAPADLVVICRWLTSHGLHIDSVPPSRMFIEFSGTVAELEAAFHTELDSLVVGGKPHYGNMSDPQIPTELAKVVVGVHALHDFMPHTMRKDRGAARRDATTGKWNLAKSSPDFDIPNIGQCMTNADCTATPFSGTCDTTTGTCACTTSNQCKTLIGGGAAQCNTTAKACVTCLTNADCIGPATCNTTTNACEHTFLAVAPADFATIYNLNPLFAQGITGAGQTVVVIEDTLLANVSDVATFRSAFGLSGGSFSQVTPAGTTTCTNSGVNNDESEAALDAEWAGASAPGAAIELASCADTSVFGGLIALQNLINGATPPPIVSISYGQCESVNGAAANASYVSTYQQAAALGTSVFVSAGDEGAASCDADAAVATHGIAVSGFASTPYNVAVGGTDFMDYYQTEQGGPAATAYWNTSNTGTFGSALSYVPEIPWNDSCASQVIYSTPSITHGTYTQAYGAAGFCNSAIGKADFRTTGSGSGGPSNYSAQPSWQTGVVGLPTKSGGVRNLPDVSLFAANGIFGHFLVYCLTDTAQGGGPCVYSSASDSLALAAGGTSFASPAMAGIQALINQKMGARQGNPNYTYYKLAGAEQGARGSSRCNSAGGTPASPVLPSPGCIFNDVTQGDIDVKCWGTTAASECFGSTGTGANAVQGSLSVATATYTSAYAAGTGWDYATGLGTVNAYNLVTAWSQ